jgi:hypothetical protein
LGFLVDNLVEDHVASRCLLEVAILAYPLEVALVTVQVTRHHYLAVVWKDQGRTAEQRILAVQRGSFAIRRRVL